MATNSRRRFDEGDGAAEDEMESTEPGNQDGPDAVSPSVRPSIHSSVAPPPPLSPLLRLT